MQSSWAIPGTGKGYLVYLAEEWDQKQSRKFFSLKKQKSKSLNSCNLIVHIFVCGGESFSEESKATKDKDEGRGRRNCP